MSQCKKPQGIRGILKNNVARAVANLLPFALTACPGTLDNPGEFASAPLADASTSQTTSSASIPDSSAATASSCPDVPSKIFIPNCTASVGCHSSNDMASNLDLQTPSSLASLVGKMSSEAANLDLVDPSGDETKSFLYLKLLPNPVGGGSRMPLGGMLSAASIACVADWIAAEAKTGGTAPKPEAGAPPTVDAGTSPMGAVDSGSASSSIDASVVDSGRGVADSGTKGMGSTEAGASVTFTALYTSIIKPTCLPCHSTGTGKTTGALNMATQAGAYTSLVGVAAAGTGCAGKGTRVVAGSSATSLFYELLQPTVPCGMRMPRTGSLTTAQIGQVATWIDQGALNN